MGHKYYIASYISIVLLAFMLIQEYKRVKIIFLLLWSSLILGNFIVYPDSFAQGWDSSLAHLPYWDLREKGIQYMDKNKLPIAETASFFPNATAIDNVDLNGNNRSFIGFTGKENFVFYSNVYNLSDEDLKTLHENYHIIQTFEKRNVRVEILKKN